MDYRTYLKSKVFFLKNPFENKTTYVKPQMGQKKKQVCALCKAKNPLELCDLCATLFCQDCLQKCEECNDCIICNDCMQKCTGCEILLCDDCKRVPHTPCNCGGFCSQCMQDGECPACKPFLAWTLFNCKGSSMNLFFQHNEPICAFELLHDGQ